MPRSSVWRGTTKQQQQHCRRRVPGLQALDDEMHDARVASTRLRNVRMTTPEAGPACGFCGVGGGGAVGRRCGWGVSMGSYALARLHSFSTRGRGALQRALDCWGCWLKHSCYSRERGLPVWFSGRLCCGIHTTGASYVCGHHGRLGRGNSISGCCWALARMSALSTRASHPSPVVPAAPHSVLLPLSLLMLLHMHEVCTQQPLNKKSRTSDEDIGLPGRVQPPAHCTSALSAGRGALQRRGTPRPPRLLTGSAGCLAAGALPLQEGAAKKSTQGGATGAEKRAESTCRACHSRGGGDEPAPHSSHAHTHACAGTATHNGRITIAAATRRQAFLPTHDRQAATTERAAACRNPPARTGGRYARILDACCPCQSVWAVSWARRHESHTPEPPTHPPTPASRPAGQPDRQRLRPVPATTPSHPRHIRPGGGGHTRTARRSHHGLARAPTPRQLPTPNYLQGPPPTATAVRRHHQPSVKPSVKPRLRRSTSRPGRPRRAAPCPPAAPARRRRPSRCGSSCRPRRPARRQPPSRRRR